MLLRLVLNKILCYDFSIFPTLFYRIHAAIARQWTVVTHGEAAAAGRPAEEND